MFMSKEKYTFDVCGRKKQDLDAFFHQNIREAGEWNLVVSYGKKVPCCYTKTFLSDKDDANKIKFRNRGLIIYTVDKDAELKNKATYDSIKHDLKTLRSNNPYAAIMIAVFNNKQKSQKNIKLLEELKKNARNKLGLVHNLKKDIFYVEAGLNNSKSYFIKDLSGNKSGLISETDEYVKEHILSIDKTILESISGDLNRIHEKIKISHKDPGLWLKKKQEYDEITESIDYYKFDESREILLAKQKILFDVASGELEYLIKQQGDSVLTIGICAYRKTLVKTLTNTEVAHTPAEIESAINQFLTDCQKDLGSARWKLVINELIVWTALLVAACIIGASLAAGLSFVMGLWALPIGIATTAGLATVGSVVVGSYHLFSKTNRDLKELNESVTLVGDAASHQAFTKG
jgi:hypothetical protein